MWSISLPSREPLPRYRFLRSCARGALRRASKPSKRAVPPVSRTGDAVVILIFFVVHWQVCVFCQSFFLHRYSAHKQFTMSPGWERFFYLFTYIAQGSSFLNPRGYAILHRMHHAYSDTEKDPHSPLFATDAMSMMLKTKHEYDDFAYRRKEPEPRFAGDYPEWDFIDKLGQNWAARLGW